MESKRFFGQYQLIPERMREGIIRYIDQSISPGHFLAAIICNDLKGAVAKADDENINLIPLYVGFFYNHAPVICWGSPEKFSKWLSLRKEE